MAALALDGCVNFRDARTHIPYSVATDWIATRRRVRVHTACTVAVKFNGNTVAELALNGCTNFRDAGTHIPYSMATDLIATRCRVRVRTPCTVAVKLVPKPRNVWV